MILVFGKTGQVATELQTYKGVTALGREQADLSDPKSCSEAIKLFKPRAVINAAAYTAVDRAESQMELAYRINGDAPGVMAMACAELDIPFVHISTDYVFDGNGMERWHEIDIPHPQNAYGRSKLKGEQAIKVSGCAYAILRTSWIVSAHGSNFVKTMLGLASTREHLTVVGDQVGGPTCASDIAKTCIYIAERLIDDTRKSGVYHYSGQPDVNWCQFANTIFELIGSQTSARPILTTEYPTPATRPLNSRLDCSVIQNTFGISRPFWRDSLKEILEELGSENEKA